MHLFVRVWFCVVVYLSHVYIYLYTFIAGGLIY
jgi:hypothetical protein